MMKYFMTDNQVIHEEEKLQDGVWVRMISPTQEECEEIADRKSTRLNSSHSH